MLVRFSLSPGACYRRDPPLDMEYTYVVDTERWRLVEKDPMQAPPELPRQGRARMGGNQTAALLLALEDFLPSQAVPPKETSPEERCLYRPESYDATLASGPEGVVQIRFALNEGVCPVGHLWGSSMALATLNMTVYAIDVRTMRILAVGNHLHLWKGLHGPPRGPEAESFSNEAD